MTDAIKGGLAVIGGLISALLGGFDALLLTLAGFCAADYVTGVTKAILKRELHSGAAFRGGLKKALIFVVVAVAVGLDHVLAPQGALFRGLAIGYYIAAEGLSILENVAACGVPLPRKLVAVLKEQITK